MPGPEDFDRVGNLLGEFCEAVASPVCAQNQASDERSTATTGAKKTPTDLSRALAAVWPEVAGVEVAANASPVQLRTGRLVVSTSSSVWAQTLQYMSDDLADRLNKHLGAGVVRQIVFRHAGWEERPPGETSDRRTPEPTAVGALSNEQKQALEELERLDLPPAVREQVERAMRASFVRTQRDSVR
jgi:hypothetical protein